MTLSQWLERIEQLHPRAWDLGLERVGTVAARLELTRPAPTVFLVAGTNGKGSTCEALCRLCRERGLSVGKSTSPHLIRFNERIVIDAEEASDTEIVGAFEAIDEARGDISLSYFEFAALASMLVFKSRGVDVAVLEIGLGGRLDAMNVVEPDVSVITRIALDHQSWLGDDRELIGLEKAGIMRSGKPSVIADINPPASLAARALEIGTPTYWINQEFGQKGDSSFFSGVTIEEGWPAIADTHVPAANLLAAVQAVFAAGIPLTSRDVAAALENFALPGRLQRLSSPAPILLDVGHNPDAAEWLAKAMSTISRARCRAVFGVFEDKDLRGIIAPLLGGIDEWYVSGMDVERGAKPETIAAQIDEAGGSVAGTYAKVSDAFDAALADTVPEDLILVFGSFNIVGGVLAHLNEHQ